VIQLCDTGIGIDGIGIETRDTSGIGIGIENSDISGFGIGTGIKLSGIGIELFVSMVSKLCLNSYVFFQ
jgi:hypothetical protein